MTSLSRAIPPRDGMQAADSPMVEWFDGRPTCATCGTGLNDNGTAGRTHDLEARPARVRLCPLGCR